MKQIHQKPSKDFPPRIAFYDELFISSNTANGNTFVWYEKILFCLLNMTQQETFKIHFIYQIAMLLPVERILYTFFIASISFISPHMFAVPTA